MNRALRLVAIAGSIGTCSSVASAQFAAIRPQYYSWEKHPILNSNSSSPDYFQYDDRFCAMVRVYIDSSNVTGTTPLQAADATIAEIVARLSEGSGTINLNNLAITIQNVGGYIPADDPSTPLVDESLAYQDVLFSFFRDDDAGPTTSQNQGDPAIYRLYQPWMGQAVGEYRLNQQTQQLECAVSPEDWTEVADPSAWLASARGQISIWNEDLGQWDPLDPVNDSGTGEYRYHVEDQASPGMGLARREWDIGYESGGLCSYLTDQQGDPCTEGVLNFKFTQLALETPSGFWSSYDLIMFYHVDDVTSQLGAGEPLGLMSSSSDSASVDGFLPADFNFDGVQDSTDAALFTTAWSHGERRADYNADGEVDALDLTQFLAALGRATSAGSGGLSEE